MEHTTQNWMGFSIRKWLMRQNGQSIDSILVRNDDKFIRQFWAIEVGHQRR